jgi:hypothetical protein
VIRFSAFLVVVAVGLLVAGVVTSKLLFVYIAIGVSGVALLALGIGVAVNWRELSGKSGTAELTLAETSAQGPAQAEPVPAEPVPAVADPASAVAPAPPAQPGLQDHPRSAPSPAAAGAAPAASGWPVTVASIPTGPSRAGYLPAAEPPPRAKPPAAPAPAAAPAPPRPAPPAPPAPQKPAPARDDDAVPPAPGGRPSAEDQPPAREQPPAGPRDKAKPAAASEPEPDSGADPPEPDSGADPAAEPELTLVHGTAPVAASDPAAPAASAPAAAESKQAGQASPDEQDKQAGEADHVGPDPSMEVTVVPGVPRYHNARCILIRFMGDSDLDKMTLAAARDVGCTPCRACLPDQPDKSPE